MKTAITYFALAGDAIKIGSTRSIGTRMAALQVACRHSIELLKTAEIGEREAHAMASTLSERCAGEWFTATPALLEWIDGLEHCESREIEPEAKAVLPEPKPNGTSKEPQWRRPVPGEPVFEIPMEALPAHTINLVFVAASHFQCTPSEAVFRLLNRQARKWADHGTL